MIVSIFTKYYKIVQLYAVRMSQFGKVVTTIFLFHVNRKYVYTGQITVIDQCLQIRNNNKTPKFRWGQPIISIIFFVALRQEYTKIVNSNIIFFLAILMP